jgi:hypothetical protein
MIQKFFQVEQKNLEVDENSLTVKGIVISTEHVDRDGDVMVQAGVVLDKFPGTYLFLHGQSSERSEIPIGRVLKIYGGEVDGVPALLADVQFYQPQTPGISDPMPLLFFDMLRQGVISGHSVGFIPLDMEMRKVTDEKVLAGKPEGEYRHITRWELLEISLCPIPANPFTLATSVALRKGIITARDLTRYGLDDIIVKMVVPFEETPTLPQDRPWDADEAVARVRRWASSDGSGEKDTIDWDKYRRAFLWVDPDGDRENFGTYHLPHHDVVDGKLCVSFRGCAACLVVLRGGRGGAPSGMTGDEIDRCEQHLKKHYAQFDAEFPEKGISAAELEKRILDKQSGVSPKSILKYLGSLKVSR